MTNADTTEDEYNEYDEFDDEEDSGLSGFSVLTIGLVMFGAFIAITWIAYHQGIKRGADGIGVETPYVAADPEPIKIETADNSTPVEDREVYDVFDGDDTETPTVLAEGPEEPVNREADDPIASIAADTADLGEAATNELDERLASLAEDDAAAFDNDTVDDEPEPVPATTPTTVSVTPTPTVATNGTALSGSHVVQVGAFRSDADARAQWARMQAKLGAYADGKAIHIETADLGDRGVYHRLRIGPFANSDAAKDYCVGLKERGQDCLIKAK